MQILNPGAQAMLPKLNILRVGGADAEPGASILNSE